MTGRPTYVYVLYGTDGAVLYVGVSGNLRNRRTQHVRTQHWWWRVRRWRLIGPFPARADAVTAERDLIRELDPRYNFTHTGRKADYHERRRQRRFAESRQDYRSAEIGGLA